MKINDFKHVYGVEIFTPVNPTFSGFISAYISCSRDACWNWVKDGKTLTDDCYDITGEFHENYAFFQYSINNNIFWNWMDINGNRFNGINYTETGDFINGIAMYSNGTTAGWIKNKKQLMVVEKGIYKTYSFENGFAKFEYAKNGNLYLGVINELGLIIDTTDFGKLTLYEDLPEKEAELFSCSDNAKYIIKKLI